jgi:hypothetical protein
MAQWDVRVIDLSNIFAAFSFKVRRGQQFIRYLNETARGTGIKFSDFFLLQMNKKMSRIMQCLA